MMRTLKRFTEKDDMLITSMVNTMGEKDGIKAAAIALLRTRRSVREHYKDFIKARKSYSNEEIEKIISLKNTNNLTWKEISKHFPGSTSKCIQVVYNKETNKRKKDSTFNKNVYILSENDNTNEFWKNAEPFDYTFDDFALDEQLY